MHGGALHMPFVAWSSSIAGSRAVLHSAFAVVHSQNWMLYRRRSPLSKALQTPGTAADHRRSQIVRAPSSAPVVDQDFITAINEVNLNTVIANIFGMQCKLLADASGVVHAGV